MKPRIRIPPENRGMKACSSNLAGARRPIRAAGPVHDGWKEILLILGSCSLSEQCVPNDAWFRKFFPTFHLLRVVPRPSAWGGGVTEGRVGGEKGFVQELPREI